MPAENRIIGQQRDARPLQDFYAPRCRIQISAPTNNRQTHPKGKKENDVAKENACVRWRVSPQRTIHDPEQAVRRRHQTNRQPAKEVNFVIADFADGLGRRRGRFHNAVFDRGFFCQHERAKFLPFRKASRALNRLGFAAARSGQFIKSNSFALFRREKFSLLGANQQLRGEAYAGPPQKAHAAPPVDVHSRVHQRDGKRHETQGCQQPNLRFSLVSR